MEKERIINNIKTHIASGNIDNATRLLEQLVLEYPDENRIQELQKMLQSENNRTKMNSFVNHLKTNTFVSVTDMIAYVTNNTEAQKIVDLYCETINNRRKQGALPDYAEFSNWIETPTKELSNNSFDLRKVQENITKWYIELLKSDSIPYVWKGVRVNFWCEFLGVPYDIHQQRFVVEKAKNTYLASFVALGEQNAKDFIDKYGYYEIGYEKIKPLFSLGKLTLYFDEDFLLQHSRIPINTIIDEINIKKREKQAIAWKAAGQCSWCGGNFKGVFKKFCSKCGRPKDC